MNKEKPELVEYSNIRWNKDWCKLCGICVEICPKQALAFADGAIVEVDGRCERDGLCERFCPDLAIEIIRPVSEGVAL